MYIYLYMSMHLYNYICITYGYTSIHTGKCSSPFDGDICIDI